MRRALAELQDRVPEIMVMAEDPEPRATHVLERGSYLTPGEQVRPGVPAALPDWPAEEPRNRLGLARWMLDPDHPLTSRVAVNRLWAQVFGQGLVGTQEDFGVQGARPSHPELLDHLAVSFVRSGWDTKALLRRLLMTDAFRRSSEAGPEDWERDPDNRYLARGPQRRLSAEMLRDSSLQLADLLVERIGGAPAKPYQPDGLWREVSGRTYTPDKGEGLYRRSLYTFWKRTSPPPGMTLFDVGGREVCAARRHATRTPLQSLVLWNDPQYVEAARGLAQRALQRDFQSDRERMAWSFRSAVARTPQERELDALVHLIQELTDEFIADPEAAGELLQVGESAAATALDPQRLAAWTCAMTTLLSSDAFLTLR